MSNNLRYEIGKIVTQEMIDEINKLQPIEEWMSSPNLKMESQNA